uniref:Uncharacterized protein n=1 Tax=Leersia perrieri TaxID=77586 RepID=A0A0D9W0J2_9ORYZ
MAAAAESNSFACPICLESFLDEAYLDTYREREQAAKDRSSEDCNGARREDEDDILVSPEPWSQTRKREIERLSDAHELISQLYSIGEIIGNNSSVQQFWKQRKYLRKNIWLQTWLRQEIQALTQDEDVDAIIFHIHGVIESFMKRQEKEHASKMTPPEKKREEFKCLLSDAARPFLLGRTERFVAEVELFLVSHLNIDAYSKLRVQRLKESTSHVSREQDVLPLPQDRSLEDHYLHNRTRGSRVFAYKNCNIPLQYRSTWLNFDKGE